ncbi:MAG: hypothetical protein ACLRQF_14970 [Thomasclavelia ramosa]
MSTEVPSCLKTTLLVLVTVVELATLEVAAKLLATTIFEEVIELCSELAYEALSAPAVH